MPGKRHFLLWGEDANVIAPVKLAVGDNKRCFGEMHFFGNTLHLRASEVVCVQADGKLVAGNFVLGKYVNSIKMRTFMYYVLFCHSHGSHTFR